MGASKIMKLNIVPLQTQGHDRAQRRTRAGIEIHMTGQSCQVLKGTQRELPEAHAKDQKEEPLGLEEL